MLRYITSNINKLCRFRGLHYSTSCLSVACSSRFSFCVRSVCCWSVTTFWIWRCLRRSTSWIIPCFSWSLQQDEFSSYLKRCSAQDKRRGKATSMITNEPLPFLLNVDIANHSYRRDNWYSQNYFRCGGHFTGCFHSLRLPFRLKQSFVRSLARWWCSRFFE